MDTCGWHGHGRLPAVGIRAGLWPPSAGGRVPVSARLDFTQVSYSCDDSWIHLCDWRHGRNFLIRVADGLVVTLPVVSTAVDWNPRNGPNAMIVMTPDPSSGRLVIRDYDLATNTLEYRSDLESPTGLPLSVRELSLSCGWLPRTGHCPCWRPRP